MRLFGANLRGAQVTAVDFRKADLREADLEGADLRESTGQGASLERANAKDAMLSGCILVESNLAGVSGLTPRQVEAAILDETTVLPETVQAQLTAASFASLARALEEIRARLTGDTVPETDVRSYRRLLAKASSLGLRVDDARVEADSPATRWVDATLLRSKLDSLLDEIRRRAS